MKKQLVIAFICLLTTVTFAQKRELKAAEKALKNNNFSEAKAAISQAESLISSMDDKMKSKFYFLKGKALYSNGAGTSEDIAMSIENLDKAGTTYKVEIAELKQAMINSMLTKGNDAYQAKNFAVASQNFENAYRLSPTEPTYLYYAASASVSVLDYDRALKLYNELRELEYTGISTVYYATNVENNEEELFPNIAMRDISVKAKTHIAPSERQTESKEAEIVKNIALIYVSKGENEKALSYMKTAREANPDDLNLLLSEANIHYKMGDNEEFKRLLEIATKKDPNNAELQYNLGVISADSGDKESAKNYYKKAIEINPKYTNAQINMAALILSEEESIIEEMNSLGSSAADDRKYDELQEKKKELYKTAIPFLESVLNTDTENISAARTLMNIYSILDDTVNFEKMKALIASIEGGN